MNRFTFTTLIALLLATFWLTGCGEHAHDHEHGETCEEHAHDETCGTHNAQAKEHEHDETCDHAHGEEAFRVPESAQRLLGLSVVTAMPRRVTGTVRFPGRFELMPDARRAYSAPLPGVIEVRVRTPQRVAAGETLFTLHAPE